MHKPIRTAWLHKGVAHGDSSLNKGDHLAQLTVQTKALLANENDLERQLPKINDLLNSLDLDPAVQSKLAKDQLATSQITQLRARLMARGAAICRKTQSRQNMYIQFRKGSISELEKLLNSNSAVPLVVIDSVLPLCEPSDEIITRQHFENLLKRLCRTDFSDGSGIDRHWTLSMKLASLLLEDDQAEKYLGDISHYMLIEALRNDSEAKSSQPMKRKQLLQFAQALSTVPSFILPHNTSISSDVVSLYVKTAEIFSRRHQYRTAEHILEPLLNCEITDPNGKSNCHSLVARVLSGIYEQQAMYKDKLLLDKCVSVLSADLMIAKAEKNADVIIDCSNQLAQVLLLEGKTDSVIRLFESVNQWESQANTVSRFHRLIYLVSILDRLVKQEEASELPRCLALVPAKSSSNIVGIRKPEGFDASATVAVLDACQRLLPAKDSEANTQLRTLREIFEKDGY